MKTVTPTELRSNVYEILDEVLETGIPIEIDKDGQRLRVVPVVGGNKLDNLIARPHAISGDPSDIVDIRW